MTQINQPSTNRSTDGEAGGWPLRNAIYLLVLCVTIFVTVLWLRSGSPKKTGTPDTTVEEKATKTETTTEETTTTTTTTTEEEEPSAKKKPPVQNQAIDLDDLASLKNIKKIVDKKALAQSKVTRLKTAITIAQANDCKKAEVMRLEELQTKAEAELNAARTNALKAIKNLEIAFADEMTITGKTAVCLLDDRIAELEKEKSDAAGGLEAKVEKLTGAIGELAIQTKANATALGEHKTAIDGNTQAINNLSTKIEGLTAEVGKLKLDQGTAKLLQKSIDKLTAQVAQGQKNEAQAAIALQQLVTLFGQHQTTRQQCFTVQCLPPQPHCQWIGPCEVVQCYN